MTHDEMIAVIKAAKEGKQIQKEDCRIAEGISLSMTADSWFGW